MPFYKHRVKAGHVGKGNYNTLVIYNYAEGLFQAIKDVKRFPMVKHYGVGTVMDSRIVDEIDFVVGVVQNAYSRLNWEQNVTTLDKIDRILLNMPGYEFQTDEGKSLVAFRDTYNNASAKVKPMIENEYKQWAQDLIAKHTDNQGFGF